MRQRCNDRKSTNYPMYGGLGVKVCERWNDFLNFIADMGERPANTSLDRIDGRGHYEPLNCRWATAKEQARNRRGNKLGTHNGVTAPIATLAERCGQPVRRVYRRLSDGWTLERALETK